MVANMICINFSLFQNIESMRDGSYHIFLKDFSFLRNILYGTIIIEYKYLYLTIIIDFTADSSKTNPGGQEIQSFEDPPSHSKQVSLHYEHSPELL